MLDQKQGRKGKLDSNLQRTPPHFCTRPNPFLTTQFLSNSCQFLYPLSALSIKLKVKSLSRVQLFVTPWTVAYHTPLSMGFSQQEYWSGLPFPFPEDLPDPGIKPRSPALQADALPSEPPGKSLSCVQIFCNPMDCSPSDSSVHGILQARILEWVAISFSRGSS